MAQDKKVKITGAVEINQGQANAELNKLTQELAEFKAGMDDIKTGITLILRSLASMAKGMGVATAETEKAAEAAEGQSKELDKASDAAADLGKKTNKVAEETGKVRSETEILRGLWQRIGHRVFDAAIAGLRGLGSYFVGLIDDANAFTTVLGKMSARGVKDIKQLQLAVIELAGELGADQLDVLKAVDLAESLGAGTEAINVAEAAWKNYLVTGMDVNRQIEISSRIARGFNLQMGEQAGIIRQVSDMAQKARVSQEMMFTAVSSMGPKLNQLGASYKDMLNVVNAAVQGGIKVEEEGPKGAAELWDTLIKSSREFGETLVSVGAIQTESSAKWLQLKSDVDAQRVAFEGLNAQVKEYRDEATAIGLLVDETQGLVNAYSALAQRKEDGERLNARERKALREYGRELDARNKELSAYDKAAGLVIDRDFKMLSAVDQVTARMEAAKQVQADLNLEMRKTQVAVEAAGEPLQAMETNLTAVADTMQQEIPGAVQAAISDENGLGKLITTLANSPEALKALPASVQTFVKAVAANLKMLTPETDSVAAQLEGLQVRGTDAFARLKNNIATIAKTLMIPVSDSLDAVSQVILMKLKEPFSEGSSVYGAVTAWAQNIGGIISAELEMVLSGDQTLQDVLRRWWEVALEQLKLAMIAGIKDFLNALWEEMKNGQPELEQKLAGLFADIGRKAMSALGSEIKSFLDRHVGGAADWWTDKLGMNQGTAQPGARTVAAQAVSGGSGSSSSNTYNIYGATDPNDVADVVSRTMSRNDRLGYNGSRVR